jgi:hypothetical protein
MPLAVKQRHVGIFRRHWAFPERDICQNANTETNKLRGFYFGSELYRPSGRRNMNYNGFIVIMLILYGLRYYYYCSKKGRIWMEQTSNRKRVELQPAISTSCVLSQLLYASEMCQNASWRKRVNVSNRQWRSTEAWDVEDPTLSRQSDKTWRLDCQRYMPAALYSKKYLLVLISVWDWVRISWTVKFSDLIETRTHKLPAVQIHLSHMQTDITSQLDLSGCEASVS